MKHKVRVTVLKKNLYPELQQAYCADPHAGVDEGGKHHDRLLL